MTLDEAVQFLQKNAKALMLLVNPQFEKEYLNQLDLAETDKTEICSFIENFFPLIETAKTNPALPIGELDKKLNCRQAFLFLLSYSLNSDQCGHANEKYKTAYSIKNFIIKNNTIFSYIDSNYVALQEIFSRFYKSLEKYTDRVIPWLNGHTRFLVATLKPSFSDFVKNLSPEQKDIVQKFSDKMKKFFEQYIRQPNIWVTDIKAGALFDPANYYLTRINLLSDPESNELAKIDLKNFFAVNPQLECFMAFEIKRLAPIVAIWQAKQLSNSPSRITSALAPRSPNTAPRSQSTDHKRSGSALIANHNDDDDEEHLSTAAFTDPTLKKVRTELSNSGRVDISSGLVSSILQTTNQNS